MRKKVDRNGVDDDDNNCDHVGDNDTTEKQRGSLGVLMVTASVEQEAITTIGANGHAVFEPSRPPRG